MIQPMTISQVARMLEAQMGIPIPPRVISDLFYQRLISEELGPVVGGRRMVDRQAVPSIKEAILKRQTQRKAQGAAHQPHTSR